MYGYVSMRLYKYVYLYIDIYNTIHILITHG
jgi:hypothetical protein